MMDLTLLTYCLVAGGIYLLIFTLLHEWLGRRLQVARGIPPEQLEPSGAAAFAVGFIMEGLFFVVIPALAYGFFAVVLPLAGIRPALTLAMVAFTLGAVPAVMGMTLRVKMWLPFVLYHLLGNAELPHRKY